jgi:hypothetical protein
MPHLPQLLLHHLLGCRWQQPYGGEITAPTAALIMRKEAAAVGRMFMLDKVGKGDD